MSALGLISRAGDLPIDPLAEAQMPTQLYWRWCRAQSKPMGVRVLPS
jgi:hypothetical protein